MWNLDLNKVTPQSVEELTKWVAAEKKKREEAQNDQSQSPTPG